MKNAKRGWAGLCAAAATIVLAASAAAATSGAQIDQSSASIANTNNGVASQVHAASASQTFTVGISGRLTDVTVVVSTDPFYGSDGDLRVAINPVDGLGNPNTAVDLAVATVSVASLSTTPTPVGVAFATPADLTAGTSYAITLTQINSAGHDHVWWAGSLGDTYAGGEPSGVVVTPTGDFAFETYMLAASSANGAARGGYCSIAGNTRPDGTPIPAGTFLDLLVGQPANGHYKGATSAYYLEGLGISCERPSGYAPTDEFVGFYGHGDPGHYPYYRKTG